MRANTAGGVANTGAGISFIQQAQAGRQGEEGSSETAHEPQQNPLWMGLSFPCVNWDKGLTGSDGPSLAWASQSCMKSPAHRSTSFLSFRLPSKGMRGRPDTGPDEGETHSAERSLLGSHRVLPPSTSKLPPPTRVLPAALGASPARVCFYHLVSGLTPT